MSIWRKLRRAKRAADEQKDKNSAAADSKPKPKPAPYKHVPTHAASDALLGAPATWREEDKKAIQAQHHRRSQINMSRNPSSLSNVTILNRDQSFTSKDYIHGMPDYRNHYPRDRTSTTSVPRKGQFTSNPSTTRSSLRSQFSPPEQSFGHSTVRRSRFDVAELAHPAEIVAERRVARPYSHVGSAAKDVKFYLPSSREVSPRHSSEDSALSSRDSSFYDAVIPAAVPARHPRRPTLESPARQSADQHRFQQVYNIPDRKVEEAPSRFQQVYKIPDRKVEEAPRRSLASPTLDRYSSTNSHIQVENDLSFIDFGQFSHEMSFPVAAH